MTRIARLVLAPIRLLLRALVVLVVGAFLIGWLGADDC